MQRRAFTLIELLVTLTIIGLLLATAAIGLAGAKAASRDSTRLSDVFGLANAFDQAASYSHGQYPTNVNNANNQIMCANETVSSSNTNNIDLSVFKNNTIPSDPKPSGSLLTTGCGLSNDPTSNKSVGYQNGYTYHTHYTVNDPNQNNKSLAWYHNSTTNDGYVYVLEVGLENQRSDQAQLVDRSFFGLPTVNDRNVYYVLGRYCGTNCYQ